MKRALLIVVCMDAVGPAFEDRPVPWPMTPMNVGSWKDFAIGMAYLAAVGALYIFLAQRFMKFQ